MSIGKVQTSTAARKPGQGRRGRTPRDQREAALEHAVCKRGRVLQHLLLVRLKLGPSCLLQRHRQPRNRVVVWPALRTNP